MGRHLVGAVLAGGDGAGLCYTTAAWWLGGLPEVPAVIHVAVRHRLEPIEGMQWHTPRLRDGEIGTHRRMPVTSPARTALDCAATHSIWTIRRMLEAIATHIPQLAETRSELEQAFLRLLHDYGLPDPGDQPPARHLPSHVRR